MSHFTIKEPFWKFSGVGLDEKKMSGDILSVDVMYKKANGERLYPNTMYIRKSIAMLCRQFEIKKRGVMLRIIPFEKMSLDKNNC
jgi:hypothetical protein